MPLMCRISGPFSACDSRRPAHSQPTASAIVHVTVAPGRIKARPRRRHTNSNKGPHSLPISGWGLPFAHLMTATHKQPSQHRRPNKSTQSPSPNKPLLSIRFIVSIPPEQRFRTHRSNFCACRAPLRPRRGLPSPFCVVEFAGSWPD